MSDVDVLICGAGPTGLMLAGDLAAAGASVTVIERRTEGSTLSRAFALHARTLELLDARASADELVARGVQVQEIQMIGDAKIDLSRVGGRFPYMLLIPQYETEAVLTRRAKAHGVEIVRGAEVTGLRQNDSEVVLTYRAADGSARERRACYGVGADGMNSVVRCALGLPFPGTAVLRSVMLADVRLDRPPASLPISNAVRAGIAFVAPMGYGWYRVIAWDRDNQAPVDAPLALPEVRSIMQRALGSDYGMSDVRWLSRFQTDERQSPKYRVNRVFLAGDAAHVHSPAGGQGMNTGLQDAANLSWRLTGALQGWAPDGLLDGYEAERHPVGKQVIRDSGRILRTALIHSRVLRGVMNGAARAALAVPSVATAISAQAAGTAVRYRADWRAHKSTGRRAPDLELVAAPGGPTRLYEALRAGRFVLITHGAGLPGWSDRVNVVAPAEAAAPETMLIRPDGYVAWAADRVGPGELSAALTAWAGAPTDLRAAPLP